MELGKLRVFRISIYSLESQLGNLRVVSTAHERYSGASWALNEESRALQTRVLQKYSCGPDQPQLLKFIGF